MIFFKILFGRWGLWQKGGRQVAAPTMCRVFARAGDRGGRPYQARHPFGVQNQRQNQRQRGFDFNIPTAFIRLGRARPVGAGCPPYY